MKILLRLCMLLFMFAGFGTAQSAEAETTGATTYTVVKGDTLSAIAKKFPGTTWGMIARANNITNADLIYPNTQLKIARTNSTEKVSSRNVQHSVAKVFPNVRIASQKTPMPESTCDLRRGLEQMKYPTAVENAFVSASKVRNERSAIVREQIYIARDGEQEYIFQISKHCVYTKRIRTGDMSEQPFTESDEHSERIVVDISSEHNATLPPETTPRYSQADEFRMIKYSLEEVLGPPYDLTRMAVAVLRHRQHKREAPRTDINTKF